MIYIHEAILMQARRWTLRIAGHKCTMEVAQRSKREHFVLPKLGHIVHPFLAGLKLHWHGCEKHDF